MTAPQSLPNLDWEPTSWRRYPAAQQPTWPDEAALEAALAELRTLPPLVFAGEARTLRNALARVSEGNGFLLHAGDCAESFAEFTADGIRDKLKVILQMSLVLTYSTGVPTLKVGRIAGQFAKPRSEPTERVGELELPSFFGHIVNDDAPTAAARTPDPSRLLRAYHQSAATLNLVRAFTNGGFADLTQVHTWNQEFVANAPEGQRYEALAAEIERALDFVRACGIDLAQAQRLHRVDLWTSHEGLVLDYEEALTRRDSLTGDWYDCSAHMLWIGERTRQRGGAHVEFFARVHNPLGVKLGPSATADEVLELCEALNPARRPGRLTLIVRMGAERLVDALPPILRAVRESGHPVVWVTDPMHANVFRTPSGVKTRSFEAIMDEVAAFFSVCRNEDVWPGGIHIEFTGEDVTECLGGSAAVLEEELTMRYESLCDPRLNARQSLDLAFRVGELMRGD